MLEGSNEHLYFLAMAALFGSLFLGCFFRKKNAKLFLLWTLANGLFFASPNKTIFVIGLTLLCLFDLNFSIPNKMEKYLFLYATLPMTLLFPVKEVMPFIQGHFSITYAHILSIFILLPLLFQILLSTNISKKNPMIYDIDKCVIGYVILLCLLSFRAPTVTDSLRRSMWYVIDILLPYYVFSRGLYNAKAFGTLFWVYFFSAFLLSGLGILEFVSKTNIYFKAFIMRDAMAPIALRAGLLRICVTAPNPIWLGFFLMVGIGAFVFLWPEIRKKNFFMTTVALIFLVMATALTFSRAAWVGSVIFFMSWVSFLKIRTRSKVLIFFALFFFSTLPFFSQVIFFKKAYSVLPYLGEEAQRQIQFREQLGHLGFQVANKHPWFGSERYSEDAVLDSLRNSDGNIDFTNTYLREALRSGYVGLFLLCSIIALSLYSSWKMWSWHKEKREDLARAGRLLFCYVMAMIFMMGTATINFGWPLIGMCVACKRFMVKGEKNGSDI